MSKNKIIIIVASIILVIGIVLLFYQFLYLDNIKTDQDSKQTTSKTTEQNNPNEYKVIFSYDDAILTDSAVSVSKISKTKSELTVRKDETYGQLPVPVKKGYVFSGWYTAKKNGERILSSHQVNLSEDQTVYARWVLEEDANQAELPILMYHWFYEAGKANSEQLFNENWMDLEEFRGHMEFLKEEEYYFPSWEEVEQFTSGVLVLPEKSIVICIDDGREDFYRLAIPLLEENDIHATGFLITSKINTELVNKYSSSNIELRSHSHNMHIREDEGLGKVYNMEPYEIIGDLHKSKEILGKGYVFCYPFGHVSEELKEALDKEGYRLAVTTVGGKVSPGMDKLELPRVRMSSGTTVEMFKNIIGFNEDVTTGGAF